MSEQKLNHLIGSNIRDYLKINGKTQEDLAQYMGVKQAAISFWCNGKKIPRMDKIDKICTYFGISRNELMGFCDPAASSPAADPAPLPSDEQQLLAGYRKLDQEDKKQIQRQVNLLLKDDKYREDASAASA